MRTGTVNRDNLLFFLVCLVVSVTLLLPGETWFQSRALCQLLIFTGIGAALLRPGGAATGRPGLFALFLLCCLPSLLFTQCAGRSVETLVLWFSYFCLFLLVRGLDLDGRRVDQAITLVCLVTTLLLLYALYQYLTDFGGLAGEVAADAGLSEGRRADLLSRLASRRVFSTFPLPTTFAQLIVIILPLMIYRCRSARGAQRQIWLLPLLLAVLVLPLTGSFGSLPVLIVLGLAVFLPRAGRWSPARRATAAGAILLTAAIAFTLVLQVRGFTPWDPAQAHNPVSQRLFNWRSAVSIWQSHPLAGVGPGNFGVAYTRHRLPGANETVVAHNSYLHLLAEGGLLPGGLLIFLVLLLGRRLLRQLLAGEGDGRERALSYAVLALLLYGCFEITVEFPGIGFPGIFLVALASRSLFPPGECERPPLRAPGAVFIAILLAAGFAWTGFWYGGRMQLEEAVSLAAEGPDARQASLTAAAAASSWNPLDPEPWVVRGAMLLATGQPQQAGAAYGQAVALDPQRAFLHHRLSVVQERLGNRLLAFLAADRAHRIYPLEPRYHAQRQRLLQAAGGGS